MKLIIPDKTQHLGPKMVSFDSFNKFWDQKNRVLQCCKRGIKLSSVILSKGPQHSLINKALKIANCIYRPSMFIRYSRFIGSFHLGRIWIFATKFCYKLDFSLIRRCWRVGARWIRGLLRPGEKRQTIKKADLMIPTNGWYKDIMVEIKTKKGTTFPK